MTAPSPLQPVLDRLAAFEPVGFPVISLYLDTGPDQNGRPYYDAFLRKELRARGESFPARSPERESYDNDQERILAYVADELQPSANGLAIFACSGSDGLFETVQLDTRLDGHSLHVADRPHVYPLARVAEQHPAFAVLIADTNAARLYVVGSGTTLRSESVTNEKTNRTSVGRLVADALPAPHRELPPPPREGSRHRARTRGA